jgi:hypothetical protein
MGKEVAVGVKEAVGWGEFVGVSFKRVAEAEGTNVAVGISVIADTENVGVEVAEGMFVNQALSVPDTAVLISFS